MRRGEKTMDIRVYDEKRRRRQARGHHCLQQGSGGFLIQKGGRLILSTFGSFRELLAAFLPTTRKFGP